MADPLLEELIDDQWIPSQRQVIGKMLLCYKIFMHDGSRVFQSPCSLFLFRYGDT